MHAMIDLETLDTPTPTNHGCAVLSIGIVKFDPRTATYGDTFYRRLGYDQASLFGTVGADTIAWWNRQDASVRAEAFTAQHDIYQSAVDLVQFMSGVSRVWGNGATFDIPIIENWLQALGHRIRWKFSAARDCRTIEDLAADIGVVRKSFIRRGDHHNALDDAIYQAEYICGMWQQLTRNARGLIDVTPLPTREYLSQTNYPLWYTSDDYGKGFMGGIDYRDRTLTEELLKSGIKLQHSAG